MTVWESICLGVVQGLTEFLPISSSGHLAAVQYWMKLNETPIIFDIWLHVATAGVAAVYFRKTIFQMLCAAFSEVNIFLSSGIGKNKLYSSLVDNKGLSSNQADSNSKKTSAVDSFESQADFLSPSKRIIWIAVALIGTAAVGFPLRQIFESFFGHPLAVASGLLCTALILLGADWASRKRRIVSRSLFWQALLLGGAQGLALMPGLSRSGATIGLALILGWPKEEAVRFSFLMSIPAILGVAFLKLNDVPDLHNLLIWLPGLAVAVVSGWMGLLLVHRVVVKAKLFPFALWCLLVAAFLGFQAFV